MAQAWQPVSQSERYAVIDVLRGFALFGVLLVNLEGDFRISLFEHIGRLHTEPGMWNELTDVLIATFLDFKAITLFSLLFGAGMAIQAERASKRGIHATLFLTRRFAVLLGIGLVHMLLIWNGDILVLYAVCGLLLLPLRRLPPWVLAGAGVGVILCVTVFGFSIPVNWPSGERMAAQALAARRVYGSGSFVEIMRFRWQETGPFIVPLLVGVLPQTAGLMLIGEAAWGAGLFREPERHRRLLFGILIAGAVVGFWKHTPIPLALAYAAAALLWINPHRPSGFFAPFAALGRMALTSYLSQSIVLGLIFYGYGFGLFGRVGPAVAALIGIAIYVAQMIFSVVWLRRYRFGPAEWLWRSLTYGRRQPMSLESRLKG
jgi:uncharacterized protein